ncbi:MbcA/ParS/Xre antitoxin family protein [Pseudomonas carnis]|uniref:MbcA/ParS/Xre antitoxin family protein n=1 Tax=Pseudomonas carnis TaxID=2487355 RepID=UPI001E2F2202|nr:MbcA/ParS/Xre antitoxin family protein [Pseudomonas carnis]
MAFSELLRDQTELVFGDKVKSAVWLSQPRAAFDGLSALEYVRDEPTYLRVKETVGSIEHGLQPDSVSVKPLSVGHPENASSFEKKHSAVHHLLHYSLGGVAIIVCEGQLSGDFEGFDDTDTIFEFYNGQKWQQAVYSYFYSYMPQAKVVQEGGVYQLHVQGMKGSVEVKRA